jgi:hypothetical protein
MALAKWIPDQVRDDDEMQVLDGNGMRIRKDGRMRVPHDCRL